MKLASGLSCILRVFAVVLFTAPPCLSLAGRLTREPIAGYDLFMRAVEFNLDLSRKSTATIPREVAAQLPASGQARVIILTSDDAEDTSWTQGAYEQFTREDDSPEDAVYDNL